jgi:CzcA family heavy metal efflux pump
MMNGLIRWSVVNRPVVLLLAAALLWFGWRQAQDTAVDVFPDLTAPSVAVLTEAPGLGPMDVEQLVTFPLEAALNGAAGVRRVRSSSATGISVVNVDFAWGTDIYRARQVVAEKLSLVEDSLPEVATRPVLGPVTSIMGEVLFLGVVPDGASRLEARTWADTVLRRRLLAVQGVAQVIPIGGEARQFQVHLDPARLDSHGVTVPAVADALRAENRDIAAGFFGERGSEYLVEARGRLRGTQDIRQVVVDVHDALPVRVEDLGEVREGAAPARGTAAVDGVPAVVLGIQKQPDANTLELTARIDALLDDVEAELPAGLKLQRDLLRQADFIQVAVDNLMKELLLGGLLVVLVVGFFLVQARATLITLTAIPLSLLVAVFVLGVVGGTINTMTLGGMAIAIGALVDDAVIDVENVVRRLRLNMLLPPSRRRRPLEVVYRASVEIRSSIVFATLIIMLVFLPLFFLDGVEGRLLQPLGLAYVAALAASLLVALTVTPALCLYLLPDARAMRREKEYAHVEWMKRVYRRMLAPVLEKPVRAFVPAVLALGATALVLPRLGSAFLPEFNEGALTVTAVTLPGTSLEESDAIADRLDRILLRHPEVKSVARRTGRADLDEHALGVETSEMEVRTEVASHEREAFLERLRADFSVVPGVAVSIGQPISHRIDHMLSGTRAAVAVKLFGPSLEELRALAQRVNDAMQDVPGVVDLNIDQQAAVPLQRVVLDREALGRHGLGMQEVAATLEAAYTGHHATEVLEAGYAYDVVLRLDDPGRRVSDLGRVPVPAVGGLLPLATVASVKRDATPNRIARETAQRLLTVSCNVAGGDLGAVVAAVRERVDPVVQATPGYRVEYGGQFESAEAARTRLLLLGAAVIVGIGVLLRMAFGHARDALFVMANLPLALIGGVVGAVLDGGILSVGSLIGFITVFGIATRNGIMLISHVRHLQLEEGETDLRAAVARAGEERLAPILMTALASGLALVPIALAAGEPGSEIQAPMAVVILCGLASSTALNMFVVPALYLRFGRPAERAEVDTEAAR